MSKLFIINPAAVRDGTDSVLDRIKRVFGTDSRIELTTGAGHATQIAASSDEAEVFAVGGDGTVREVADGIVRRIKSEKAEGLNRPLPVFSAIPAGSGNDFARAEYGRMLSPDKVLDNFASGMYSPERFDVGKANDSYYVNIASVGFDAEIVNNAERYKKSKLTRRFSYILSIFYTVFRFKGVDVEIDIDGERFSRKMLLIAAANGQYYGGGIKIAPNADISDGLFDIIYIPMLHPLRTFLLLPRLLNGSHVKLKVITVKRGKRLTVRSKAGEMLLNVDGEISKTVYSEFTLLPSEMMLYTDNGKK